jgi:hypothetical protein
MHSLAIREFLFKAYIQGASLREIAAASGVPLRTLQAFKRKDHWDMQRAEFISRTLIEESKKPYEVMVLRQQFIEMKAILNLHLKSVIDKMTRGKQTSFRASLRAMKLVSQLARIARQIEVLTAK